jgi:hypothetical protein
MWPAIVAAIVEALVKIGLKKKAESDSQVAAAQAKTIESVNTSLAVEKDIRDKQKEVDKNPPVVEDADGGCNFDKFNKGE